MVRRAVYTILLMALINTLGPFSRASEIKCFVLQPPEQVLPGVRKVAVLDFSAPQGRTIADYLIAAMLQSKRGIHTIKGGLFTKDVEGVTHLEGARTDVFTLVERSRLDQVMKEQSFGVTGFVNDAQAAALGKILGVDALVMGTSTSSAEDVPSQEQRIYYKDKKEYTVNVNCVTRKANVRASMRVINATTGEILGTRESTQGVEEKKCGSEDLSKLATKEALINACLTGIAHDLANYLCPRFVMSEFELSDIDVDEYEELGEKSGDEAEAGNIDKAHVGYAAIVKEDPYNDAALYNLGVLNEVVGNFQDAEQYYQKALGVRETKDYSNALARCKRSIQFNNALMSVGITIAKHTFDLSESRLQSATAKKVKLVGGSGDRIMIRATPEESGAIVAKVPGGIELQMLDEKGDWFRVRTFDGKEGYVSKSDVR